jgi:hypothetical protein
MTAKRGNEGASVRASILVEMISSGSLQSVLAPFLKDDLSILPLTSAETSN